MAGPRVDDSYNPVPTQGTGSMNNNYLTTRATPDSAGAGIGEALQGTSRALGKVIDTKIDYDLQEMGLANEHAANESEIQLSIQGGDIDNEFQTLSGLDAANSKDQYIQKYLETNNKIREALPNDAAKRAYDTVAGRRIAFTIQNMNGYAARQEKQAYRDGRVASIKLSTDRMSRYEVAKNQEQFDFERDNVVFQANTVFTAPKYGLYQTVPFKEDPVTHRLVYDTSTDQGRIAQDNYDNYLNENLGKGYVTATKALLNDPNGSYQQAEAFFEANKDKMPAATQAEISQSLAAPRRMAETRGVADTVMKDAPRNSDWLAYNEGDLRKKAAEEAERIHPGDITFASQVDQQITQKVNMIYRDQSRINTANSHALYDYINKNKISNISQLNNAPPAVKRVFDDYIGANPQALPALERMITGKSFSRATGYGTKFYKNTLDALDGKVKDVVQLGNNIDMSLGNDSPLTNTGSDRLGNLLKNLQDEDGTIRPEAAPMVKSMKGYLVKMQQQYTGTGLLGGNKDPYRTNTQFQNALTEVFPQIEAGMKSGKTPEQLFSPTINGKPNPDYVRPVTQPPPLATLTRQSTRTFSGSNKPEIKTQQDLEKAYKEGKIDLVEARKLIDKNGWKRDNGPSVPVPE